jgi:hypothetical protein
MELTERFANEDVISSVWCRNWIFKYNFDWFLCFNLLFSIESCVICKELTILSQNFKNDPSASLLKIIIPLFVYVTIFVIKITVVNCYEPFLLVHYCPYQQNTQMIHSYVEQMALSVSLEFSISSTTWSISKRMRGCNGRNILNASDWRKVTVWTGYLPVEEWYLQL